MMKKWKHKRHNVPPNPSPFPLHIHTVHVWHLHLAADFQLNFRIEVNITVEPFHPSSQVNGSTLAGWGVGLKTFSMGRLCIKCNPLLFFCIPFLTEKVHVPHSVHLSFLAKSLPFHIQGNWSLRKVPLLGGPTKPS